MARRSLAVLFLSLAIAIVLPSMALAQVGSASPGGLVPCGVGDGPDVATECQACHVVQLVQNVIMFLIGLSIPLAMAMFAYAGLLYFTSGAGGSENIGKAKKIFTSSLLGFVLALAAWLIVNTVLYTVLDKERFPDSSWFRIDCSNTRVINTPGGIGQVIAGHLGIAPEVVEIPVYKNPLESSVFYTSAPTLTCEDGYKLTAAGKCQNAAGKTGAPPKITYTTVTGGSFNEKQLLNKLAGTYNYQTQLQAICASEGLNDCKLAQAVMSIESNGKSYVTSPMGAVGLMQVMPTTACSLNKGIQGCTACLAGKGCGTVTKALKDPTLNMTLGVKYLKQLQNQFTTLPNVIAAYNGGPKANSNSVSCPGQTFWACTANEGYAETRNYVPNVINALTLIK